MFPIMLPISPETIAFLSAQTEEESDYEAAVLQARKYQDGHQFVQLTDRLREFLGGDTGTVDEDFNRLRLNVCRIVLNSVVDRLILSSFDSTEVPTEQPTVDERGQPTIRLVKPVATWAWQVWQQNRMDALQRRIHEMALRDSEAFLLVDWDVIRKRPIFIPHQRFVDGSLGGDNEGCRAYYKNDDPDQDLLFVTKRWTQVWYDGVGARMTRLRLTVYLPGEIRKYAGMPGAWEKTVDSDTEPWPIPWVHKDKRTPLGIPVSHFRSTAGMEAREAWPIQNAINKSFVDLMTESDMAAFRILLAFGWEPIVAGSKTAQNPGGTPLDIAPGKWMGTANKDAKAQEIAGADLSQFLNVIESLMAWCATVTDTPLSRFITTKQVSAEGSQKQGDAPLINKARNRQSEMGDGWERAFELGVRLANTFGGASLDESVQLMSVWQPLEARDAMNDLAEAVQRKALGMPIRLVARGLDLSQEDIALWEQEAEQRKADAAAQFGQPPSNA